MQRKNIQDKDVTNPTLFNWLVPVYGLIDYANKNFEAKTIDVNNYANGFWHLAVAHIGELAFMGSLIGIGLEKIL